MLIWVHKEEKWGWWWGIQREKPRFVDIFDKELEVTDEQYNKWVTAFNAAEEAQAQIEELVEGL